MNIKKYTVNAQTCMIFTQDGGCTCVTKSDPSFNYVRAALLDGDIGRAETYLRSVADVISESENFSVKEGAVLYKGRSIPTGLGNRVKEIIRSSGDLKPLAKFMDRLSLNPSSKSASELYDFLTHADLAITSEGTVLAYKGVQSNLYSVSGNLHTRVLRGKLDSSGHIYNGVGEVIEVVRQDVDDVRENTCSHGLHCGAVSYASKFGPKMVIVEFDPADAVSVPEDHSCMKLRVCKYKVIKEVPNSTVLRKPVYSVDAVGDDPIPDAAPSAIRAKAFELIRDNPTFRDESEVYAFLLSSLLIHFGCKDELVEREVEQIMLERQKAAKTPKVEVKVEKKAEPKKEVKSDASIVERIEKYLLNKGTATLRQIQSSLSPKCPSLDEIKRICEDELGYDVTEDHEEPKGNWWVEEPAGF